MRKYMPIAVTGVVFVTLVVLVAGAWKFLDQPQQAEFSPFPDQMNVRVLLPGSEREEVNRKVTYKDDGFTVDRISVAYPDGSSAYALYRENGTVSEVIKFYPPVHDSPSAKMMEQFYAEDGEHVDSERHFYADGSIKSTGTRLVSGDFLVQNFAHGEAELESESVYNVAGIKYDVFERHSNGKFAKLVLNHDGGVYETTFFESGLKATYHSAFYSTKVWETYQPDGKTLVDKFELKHSGDEHGVSYEMHGTYFNDDGSVNHTREFTRYYMSVNYYDTDGTFLYQQRWFHKKSAEEVDSFAEDQWRLTAVGFNEAMMIGTTYWFRADGTIERYFQEVELPNGETKLETREYRPDGSISLFRRPNPEDLTGKFLTDNYKPGESDERFDYTRVTKYLGSVPFKVPPEITPESIPGM